MGAFLLIVVIVLVVLASSSVRMVQQYQRGVVLRFGKLLSASRAPGLTMLVPFADRMTRVSMQTTVLDIPAQNAITRDNVSIAVDAVVYFRVVDPARATVNVQDYLYATSQVAQTSMRSIIGRADLDTLLSDREQINSELRDVLDAPTEEWGVHVERVEIKDVSLPEGMRRSMSRQAEAERERRARVIVADAELRASDHLSQAAAAMAATPGALQLRMLQTVTEVAAEKNSTLVMPFPVELLRFFEKGAQGPPAPGDRDLSEAGDQARRQARAAEAADPVEPAGPGAVETGAVGTGGADPAPADPGVVGPADREPPTDGFRPEALTTDVREDRG